MKVEEVILRAVSGQITFWQAARILRMSPRHLRRVLQRYRHSGFDGLLDRRQDGPAPSACLGRSPSRCCACIVKNISTSACVTSTKSSARSTASPQLHLHQVVAARRRTGEGKHETRPPPSSAGASADGRHAAAHRRQPPSMAGRGTVARSAGGARRRHQRIYYAQLVEEESTATVLAALWEVVENQGIFCALYSDRAAISGSPRKPESRWIVSGLPK